MNPRIARFTKMNDTIKLIHETIRSCKTGLKNIALFRNMTDLFPVLKNQERRSSVNNTILMYSRIENAIAAVVDSTDSFLSFNRSPALKSKIIAVF